MSSDRGGRLVVLSGPTACGKSTIWRRLVAHPQISFSVSATTRSPRRNEIDGRDYRFVSAGEFSQLIDQGAFLEWAHWVETLLQSLSANKSVCLSVSRFAHGNAGRERRFFLPGRSN